MNILFYLILGSRCNDCNGYDDLDFVNENRGSPRIKDPARHC